ncbi:DUF559 domain-containing protein [Hazenella sp. IB182353]|uniref:endonuclease domain-containing protein n=1 Tax=Polycladospora coralii TaxID=2771432 RepID=UPI00174621A0|nr:DUF559 domain-containing protein [Polycladospora coralii]MBS7531101.1 DUF559 domain-containing protein [Polycladospora coralii]
MNQSKLRLWLQKRLKARRRKHYKKYQTNRELESLPAFLRAIGRMIESRILGDTAVFDYQFAKTQSPIERRVYNALKSRYKLKTQVKVDKYRIDIAIPKYKIAIECDGKAFHSSHYDKKRDRYKDEILRAHGWTVLRFTGTTINKNMKVIFAKVQVAVDAYEPPWYRKAWSLLISGNTKRAKIYIQESREEKQNPIEPIEETQLETAAATINESEPLTQSNEISDNDDMKEVPEFVRQAIERQKKT